MNTRKLLQGKVVSDKMAKTRVVAVERAHKHSLYSKILKRTTKYKVHDANNLSNIGDIVEIAYLRPVSKEKSWELFRIVKKASN